MRYASEVSSTRDDARRLVLKEIETTLSTIAPRLRRC
jgi:hypothetical protein